MTRRRTLFLLLAVLAVGAVVATVLVVGRDTSDRPRELAMTAVPPCELISQADLEQLDVISQPSPGHNLEYGEEGTGCRFFALRAPDVELNVITNYGIDRWADGGVGSATFEDVARIKGFRVIKVTTPSGRLFPDNECRLYVDVADDQSLKVIVDELDRREGDRPVCEVAYQAAEAAMRTLTSR